MKPYEHLIFQRSKRPCVGGVTALHFMDWWRARFVCLRSESDVTPPCTKTDCPHTVTFSLRRRLLAIVCFCVCLQVMTLHAANTNLRLIESETGLAEVDKLVDLDETRWDALAGVSPVDVQGLLSTNWSPRQTEPAPLVAGSQVIQFCRPPPRIGA